jgi:hypothetical protein
MPSVIRDFLSSWQLRPAEVAAREPDARQADLSHGADPDRLLAWVEHVEAGIGEWPAEQRLAAPGRQRSMVAQTLASVGP